MPQNKSYSDSFRRADHHRNPNLASITVHQILRNRDTPEHFMGLFESPSEILEGLKNMVQRGLLWSDEDDDEYFDNHTHFFLTDEGILKIRKFWSKLPKLLEEKDFDSWITTNASSNIPTPSDNSQKFASFIASMKMLANRLREKLNNRLEDEVVDAAVTAAKQHGSRALSFLIQYVLDNTKSGT